MHNFAMSNTGVRSVWIACLAPLLASAALLGSSAGFAAPKSTKAKHADAASTAQADSGEGEIKFNTFCRQCHSFLKGDNRLGPSLYGIVGRKAGTAPGYLGYSSAMKAAGWTWTPAMIDQWITNPYKILPNTNMRPFPGVPDEKTRRMIIAFLSSHHD